MTVVGLDVPTQPGDTATVQLAIGGMACGACAARVEKALRAQDGVVDAGVNFATARARVAFRAGETGVGAVCGLVGSLVLSSNSHLWAPAGASGLSFTLMW